MFNRDCWDVYDYQNKYQLIDHCLFTAQTSIKPVETQSLDYYLKERQDIPNQERYELIAMMKMIANNQLNKVCSEELLKEVSLCIQDWRTIAPFLGLQGFYNEKITSTYTEAVEQCYQLLLLWKERVGKQATYYHLLKTIVAYGRSQEIRALIEIPQRG